MSLLDRYLKGPSGALLHFEKARRILAGHLFGALSIVETCDRLATLGFYFDRPVRTRFIRDPEIIRLKFPLYVAFCHSSRFADREELLSFAHEQGLPESESYLLDLVMEGPLAKHLARLKAAGYKPLSAAAFQRELDRVVQETAANTKGYVLRSMRFLMGYTLTLDELIADCVSGAFEALLQQYPIFENRAHFQNLYKMALRQAGQKIIKYYTADCRGSSGGSLVRFNYDPLRPLACDESDQEEITPESMQVGLYGNDADYDSILHVRRVMQSGRLRDRDLHFLELVVGLTDSAFEVWLQEQVLDIEAVILRGADGTPRYIRLVRQYLGYTAKEMATLKRILSFLPAPGTANSSESAPATSKTSLELPPLQRC